MPRLKNVAQLITNDDRTGLEVFIETLKNNAEWRTFLNSEAQYYMHKMDEGYRYVHTFDDTFTYLEELSLLIRRSHCNKQSRWAVKKLRYIQKILKICYLVNMIDDYYDIAACFEQDDYDY
jgi:hypothetical protein